MNMIRLATWCLVIGSYSTAVGQTGVREGATPASNSRLLSSLQQSDNGESLQRLRQREQPLLTAKAVFVVVDEASPAYPTAKAKEALKKALIKWGRFQLVDDAAAADLIIIISDCSSSKRMMMEHVSESMAVFAGGSIPGESANPMWSVEETGPAFANKRPTRRLVEDFKRDLIELEKSIPAPTISSKVSQSSKDSVH